MGQSNEHTHTRVRDWEGGYIVSSPVIWGCMD